MTLRNGTSNFIISNFKHSQGYLQEFFPLGVQNIALSNIIINFVFHKKVNVAFGKCHDKNEGMILQALVLITYYCQGTLFGGLETRTNTVDTVIVCERIPPSNLKHDECCTCTVVL